MPAPASSYDPHSVDTRSLGHVNLMVDTFIANASAEDLRSTVRTLLATTPPTTAAAFCKAARLHLSKGSIPRSSALFTTRTSNGTALPTPQLRETLARARILYGAGMGLASLSIFTTIVQQTIGLRWTAEGETADVLTLMDGDVCQAMQSCKEEIERGAGTEAMDAREKAEVLRGAVMESERDVAGWGGEFPFERALASLECWKI